MTVWSLLDMAPLALIATGVLFFISGTIGLVRFPDVFCRLHALTKADNLLNKYGGRPSMKTTTNIFTRKIFRNIKVAIFLCPMCQWVIPLRGPQYDRFRY